MGKVHPSGGSFVSRLGIFKQELLYVIIAIVTLGLLTVFLSFRGNPDSLTDRIKNEFESHNAPPPPAAPVISEDIPKEKQKEVTTDSGLKYIDLATGNGDKAKIGSKIGVIYTGTLKTGEKFDSNVGKAPYSVTIGEGRVIKGWEIGLLGMQAGSKRKLIIPYQLAYGEGGQPPVIPPRADLFFEIEVVSVTNRK
ncbi:MAG: FKBP-type peptidyl-prolyl cis-trans isomerase [Planctomycetia bacterium]|nr:FKBP-type peptidyl-prolyl cis-trans isomerase [Planctomycetia bacterium]